MNVFTAKPIKYFKRMSFYNNRSSDLSEVAKIMVLGKDCGIDKTSIPVSASWSSESIDLNNSV